MNFITNTSGMSSDKRLCFCFSTDKGPHTRFITQISVLFLAKFNEYSFCSLFLASFLFLGVMRTSRRLRRMNSSIRTSSLSFRTLLYNQVIQSLQQIQSINQVIQSPSTNSKPGRHEKELRICYEQLQTKKVSSSSYLWSQTVP